MDQIWIKEYCVRYWQVKYKVKSYPTKKWVFGPVEKGCELTSEKKKFKALDQETVIGFTTTKK